MRRLCLTLSLGFLGACTTTKTTHAYQEDLKGKSRVLPQGTYLQTLDLLISARQAQRFELKVDLAAHKVAILGFRAGQKQAAFKVLEDHEEKIAQLTLFDKALEPFRSQIEGIYVRLRPLLFIGVDAGMSDTKYLDFDANGVPRNIEVAAEGMQVSLKIQSYELQ